MVQFQLSVGRAFNVFLLENGTEFGLIAQYIITIQPTLHVKSDMVSSLSQTLARDKFNRCDPGATSADMTACVVAKIKKLTADAGIPCVPYVYKESFSSLGLPDCIDEAEARKILQQESLLIVFIST